MTKAGTHALAELAEALGLDYELDYSRSGDAERVRVSGRAKLRRPGSKRYAVIFMGRGRMHEKQINVGVAVDRGASPTWPLRDGDVRALVADAVVARLLKDGCRMKLSKHRTIEVPPASCVEELRLKMAVLYGHGA